MAHNFFRTLVRVVIILVVLAAVMLAITWFVPQVRDFAQNFSDKRKVAFWIVGLFAPVLFAFKGLSEWLSGWFRGILPTGTNAELQRLQASNDAIKAQLAALQSSVAELDAKRTSALQAEMAKINTFQAQIQPLLECITMIDANIQDLQKKPSEWFTRAMSDEDVKRELARREAAAGIRNVTPKPVSPTPSNNPGGGQ
ncbi:MAG: DUF3450 domain-containing protein [Candidatus Kapabacteria bacterium]|jgi:peptidoglycan hydrolase CwlO-like protein|nr:DUF3450 domain-containing protein [Candidatus Kapabacteria bacterium]